MNDHDAAMNMWEEGRRKEIEVGLKPSPRWCDLPDEVRAEQLRLAATWNRKK